MKAKMKTKLKTKMKLKMIAKSVVCICFLSGFFIFSQMSSAAPLRGFEGGVSGGGGNLLEARTPLKPIHPEVAEKIVHDSYAVFLTYIGQKRKDYFSKKLSPEQQVAFAPIFEAAQEIEAMARNRRMQVDDHSPCWDSNHRPVDGSTLSRLPNSICISAFTIAQKSEVNDIAPQSAALMLHEYGELVGLTETEAVGAQIEALKDLREIAYY